MAMADGFVRGGPLLLLRFEGAAASAAAAVGYGHLDHSWWLFAALILVPDLSIAGYLAGARAGSICYNVAHTVTGPAIVIATAFLLDSSLVASIGAIWLAHIGFDRMLGFGLKYSTGFADTHLGALGASSRLLKP